MRAVAALAGAQSGSGSGSGFAAQPGVGAAPEEATRGPREAPGADAAALIPGADTAELISRLTQIGHTVAVAESLTGGLVLAALTSVPGASAVVRGGVVAYADDVKTAVLGVDPELLRQASAVSGGVAVQMARGCRSLMGAIYGVATTGEAGPDSASGQPIGTFYVAVCGPQGEVIRRGTGAGGRAQVRRAAVDAALALLSGAVPDAAVDDAARRR